MKARTLKKDKVNIITLGCSKNMVDSEVLSGQLRAAEIDVVHESGMKDHNIVIVNTCGFIDKAKEESINTILDQVSLKQKGRLDKVYVTGCLSQRYRDDLEQNIPEVDAWFGTMEMPFLLKKFEVDYKAELIGERLLATPQHYAYVKIAEGCNRTCAFCAIPLIKGTAVSRPVSAIVEEARHLRDAGVRELILIAQDTTDYGHDLGIKDGLAVLLEQLTDSVPDMDWIRVMYAYPGYVTDRLIEVMATRKQVLPYLDMPLQHAHPKTLYRMRRPSNIDWVHRTLGKMRSAIPNLSIRTTCIVGYPGETEEEYQALVDFVQETRFDRVGTFQFSFEPGTTSEPLGDPIPAEVKQERYERLLELQQGISLQVNQSYVGKTLDVLVEGRDKGIAIGRSYRDAPEIDGMVFIEGNARIGDIVPVKITGAMAYDLTGVPEKQSIPLQIV
ncbi:MAG: 30S ribosomal protein S12 methylthiotransferase RimO [Chitinophagaceae bacterium]